jgi:lipopolysaccharide export system permease protein
MKILSKHIFKEFITLVAGVLTAIIIVYLCVEFLQKADRMIKHHATLSQVIRYFLFRIPGMISLALPMATLIASLLALGNLSRHNEIIAMRAGVVSLLQTIIPLLFGGLLLSVLGFLNNEYVMPVYSSRANYIRNIEIEKKQRTVMYQQNKLWLRGPDNSIVNIALISPNRKEVIGLNIYKLYPDYSIRERIWAKGLVWENGAWHLQNSVSFTHINDIVESRSSDGEVFNVVDNPDDLGMIAKDSEEMSFSEMWDYVRRLKSSGYKVIEYEVDLHRKLAYPLSSFLMIMMSIPFSIRKVRSGETSRGFAFAILIVFIYWTLSSIGSSLGHAGLVPPALSAWLANIFFAATSAGVLFKMQRSL